MFKFNFEIEEDGHLDSSSTDGFEAFDPASTSTPATTELEETAVESEILASEIPLEELVSQPAIYWN